MADRPVPRVSFKERNATLVQRVRNSELFPRIRDVEAIMEEEQQIYAARIENKKRKLLGKPARPLPPRNLTEKPSPSRPKKTELIAKDYFSSHVLNKDPACSQYMPFDVVYFPKLFNKNEATYVPQSLDYVWMLGFQHLSENASKIASEGPNDKNKKKAVDQGRS